MDDTQVIDPQQQPDHSDVAETPEGAPPLEPATFGGWSEDVAGVVGPTIRPEEFDLSDGINTETEAAAAITGDFVVDSLIADPEQQNPYHTLPGMHEFYPTQDVKTNNNNNEPETHPIDDTARGSSSAAPEDSFTQGDLGPDMVTDDSHEFVLEHETGRDVEVSQQPAADAEKEERARKEAEYRRAMAQIPPALGDAMWGGPSKGETDKHWFDAEKALKILPVLESMGLNVVDGKYSDADRALVRRLLIAARCGETPSDPELRKAQSEQHESFLSLVESLKEHGYSLNNLLKLAHTDESMQQVIDLHNEDPGSLADKSSALGMILRVSELALSDLVPIEQDEDYYANSQGKERDVRDSVIAKIAGHHEKIAKLKKNPDVDPGGIEFYQTELQEYSLYISQLEEKLPLLKNLNFPMDRIGKTVLNRFNTYVSSNNPVVDYEVRIVDRCIDIGKNFRELENIDPAFAEIVIFGEDSTDEIVSLGSEINRVKVENPEAYAVFETIKEMNLERIDSVRLVATYLKISQKISESSQLYEMVKDEKVEPASKGSSMMKLPPNLRHLLQKTSLQSIAEPGRLERFFENCDRLSSFIADNRLETDRIFHVADSLEPEEVETFITILSNEQVQDALDDPRIAQAFNYALPAITGTLDADLVLRSLDFIATLDEDTENYYIDSLGTIIQDAGDLDRESLFRSLRKAAGSKDKDGFPYDSVRSVMGAIEFLTRETKRTNDPEAERKRLLEWFEASSLPYSALPAVISMAEEAKGEGVPDDPMAIYEWIYEDPDRVEIISQNNLRRYLVDGIIVQNGGILSRKHSVAHEELDSEIERARQESAKREPSFRIFVNLRQQVIMAALKNAGNIDSLFDRVEMTDRGARYNLIRSGVEIALGIRSLESTDEHRVYGSCGFVDSGVPEGAKGYGDIVIVFSPDSEALQGTTFTPEDSFHGAARLTREDAMTLRHIKDEQGVDHAATTSYVEAQIPGDVTLYDAEQIVASSEEQAEQLRKDLPPELAIKVVTR